jgi:hypothetical protein
MMTSVTKGRTQNLKLLRPTDMTFHWNFFFNEVRGAASNSAYYGYPELWI